MVRIRKEFPHLNLILLPQLPRRFGGLLRSQTIVPYQNPAPFILKSIEQDLGLSSEEVWGVDIKQENYTLSDERLLEIVMGADALHIQGMVNVAPLYDRLVALGSPSAKRMSITVYDLVPILYPEYCDDGVARWFKEVYLPAIGRCINQVVCISKKTARDLFEYSVTQDIKNVSVLSLPFDLASQLSPDQRILKTLFLEGSDYLVFLGSLEPRKNFEGLLLGFETFRKLVPSSSMKLVLVGGTGWKNQDTESKIQNSPYQQDIIRTGYFNDSELHTVLKHSVALAMVSQYEGYGLPVAQAYSLGVNIITTYGSSLPEACQGEAFFVEPHDPFSICAGIQQTLRFRAKEGTRAMLKTWNWDNYARNLLKLVSKDCDAPLSTPS